MILNFFKKLWDFLTKSNLPPGPPPAVASEPSQPARVLTVSEKAYEIAKKEMGVAETPGDDDNPRIIEYDKATDLGKEDWGDAVPWCSAFMNWCIQKAGGKGTRDAMARSWLNWGQHIIDPIPGDTVIFSSPTRGPEAGHVAFYVGQNIPGFIKVLGGNQGNAVSVQQYPSMNVLGYRRSFN